MKVLHVLQMSIPNLSGYAIRSKYIVESQKTIGIEPIVITSPFQKGKSNDKEEVIDGIKYIRTKQIKKNNNKIISRLQYIRLINFKKDIGLAVRQYKPDIIHAHSSFFCGLPASWVGKKYNIPVIYEMRGVWEDSAVANGKLRYNSLPYRIIRYLEQKTIDNVDSIVVISDNLEKELIGRNIDKDKINIVYNGVDIKKFRNVEKNMDIIKKYNLENNIVLGYIGSVIKLEGLRFLIEAFSIIKQQKNNVKLLIVGNGSELENLIKLAQEKGVRDDIVFTGYVDHKGIIDYYSVIDIFVLPRLNSRVSNLVTPLKPLEIMSMGKPIVASDVGGITEIIQDNETGVVFESENIESLYKKCLYLIDNESERNRIANNAIEWVGRNRSWEININSYIKIYNNLKK